MKRVLCLLALFALIYPVTALAQTTTSPESQTQTAPTVFKIGATLDTPVATVTVSPTGGIVVTSAPAATTPAGPQFIVGLGGAYNKYAIAPDPLMNMWFNFSARMKGPLYSLSTLDVTAAGSTLRTGLEYIAYVDPNGNVTLFLLGQAGLTVSASSAANAANGISVGNFSGGMGIAGDLQGVFKSFKGKQWGVVALIRFNTSNATTSTSGALVPGPVKPIFEIGILKGLGK
jgi:hypothetical protein